MSISRDYALSYVKNQIVYYDAKRSSSTSWTQSKVFTSGNFADTGVSVLVSSHTNEYDLIDSTLKPYIFYVLIPRDLSGYDDSTTALNATSLIEIIDAQQNSLTWYSEQITDYNSELSSFYIEHSDWLENYVTVIFMKLCMVNCFYKTNQFEDSTSGTNSIKNVYWSMDNIAYTKQIGGYWAHTPYLKMLCTANDGYEFSTINTYESENFSNLYEIFSSEISDDKKTMTIVYRSKAIFTPNYENVTKADTYEETWNIYPIATEQSIVTIPITGNLSNCNGTIPENITQGETLSLTLNANEDYYFASSPYITYYKEGGIPLTYDFTLSSDTKTATIEFNTTDVLESYGITITASATPETTYKDKYGTIYVYHVTVENLQDFATKRFFTDSTSVESVDLGNYVAKLHKIYCNLGVEGSDTLKLGNYDTSISVNVPYNDIIEIECGSITISGANSDITDYLGSIKIFLPFIGLENIDLDTAIDHIISLKYNINIITGDTVAFIYIDDICNYVFNGKCARNIYYLTRNEEKLNGNISFESEFMYGFTPYILHTYYTGYNAEIYTPTSIRTTVSNMQGYFKMNELTNISFVNDEQITIQEIEAIRTTLEGGVYYE